MVTRAAGPSGPDRSVRVVRLRVDPIDEYLSECVLSTVHIPNRSQLMRYPDPDIVSGQVT